MHRLQSVPLLQGYLEKKFLDTRMIINYLKVIRGGKLSWAGSNRAIFTKPQAVKFILKNAVVVDNFDMR